jgi:hypothetical protein
MSTPKTSACGDLSLVSSRTVTWCRRRKTKTREPTKDDDPVHDPLGSPRDLLGRVGSFTGGQDDRLGTGVRVGGADEGAVEMPEKRLGQRL